MLFRTIKIFLLHSLLFGFAFTSCKPKAEPEAPTVETPIYQSPEFMEFYDRFGTDTAFQAEHIVWPLEGIRSMKDSTDIVPADFRWQRQGWVMHRPYDDGDGSFNRTISALNASIVVEKIQDQSGAYSMERRFGKLSSGWHLIYYRELGPY
jgi:hypothetical protein